MRRTRPEVPVEVLHRFDKFDLISSNASYCPLCSRKGLSISGFPPLDQLETLLPTIALLSTSFYMRTLLFPRFGKVRPSHNIPERSFYLMNFVHWLVLQPRHVLSSLYQLFNTGSGKGQCNCY